jgi:hypothetical protein
MPTERDRHNHRYELSPEDQEKVDAALAAITRVKAAFDDWLIIGHAIAAARKHADRVGGRKAFQTILAEQRIRLMHEATEAMPALPPLLPLPFTAAFYLRRVTFGFRPAGRKIVSLLMS